MSPDITGFYDERTGTISYLVADPESGRAAVIDPVLDYAPRSGRTWTESADQILAAIAERGLTLEWILETHAHADHMTAAAYLREATGARVAIGTGITRVQQTWKDIYNFGDDFPVDGSQFDRLFADGDSFRIGGIAVSVIATPGHTPDSISYVAGDAVFSGDLLLMPDAGTGRCDFPGGDPRVLYRSVRRIFEMSEETRIFVGHDYAPGGREPAWESSVGAQRAENVHVRDGIDEDAYVEMRSARDKVLRLPALLLPAIQVNLRAGRLPPPESNGTSYLKIPLNRF